MFCLSKLIEEKKTETFLLFLSLCSSNKRHHGKMEMAKQVSKLNREDSARSSGKSHRSNNLLLGAVTKVNHEDDDDEVEVAIDDHPHRKRPHSTSPVRMHANGQDYCDSEPDLFGSPKGTNGHEDDDDDVVLSTSKEGNGFNLGAKQSTV